MRGVVWVWGSRIKCSLIFTATHQSVYTYYIPCQYLNYGVEAMFLMFHLLQSYKNMILFFYWTKLRKGSTPQVLWVSVSGIPTQMETLELLF